ncbi:acyl-CoA dehydrogenase family protein [Thermaurantiacus sp.]
MMLLAAFERLLETHCSPQVVRSAEAGTFPAALAAELAASGFLDLLVPEEAGGAGLPLAELFPLAVAAGRRACPLPFAETAVARGLLARAAFEVPAAAWILPAPPSPLHPMARLATHALVEDADGAALVEMLAAGDDPWGTGGATRIEAGAVSGRIAGIDLAATAAALGAARIAGLVEAVAELTLAHVTTRQQFGRALAGFQAIQQAMAQLAEEVIAARSAASLAFAGEVFARLPAAVAKARASEAARAVQAIAHQAHGAIGMTAEYDLGLFTRRLQEARMAHGSEGHWHCLLGEARASDRAGTAVDFLRRALEVE